MHDEIQYQNKGLERANVNQNAAANRQTAKGQEKRRTKLKWKVVYKVDQSVICSIQRMFSLMEQRLKGDFRS